MLEASADASKREYQDKETPIYQSNAKAKTLSNQLKKNGDKGHPLTVWSNGLVERFNGRIAEVLATTDKRDTHLPLTLPSRSPTLLPTPPAEMPHDSSPRRARLLVRYALVS
ncbi:hypothetical protein, partial [Marichromatium gracile]|uniref:hypothetical protein n=1 Tax=Marichromatium gracile TaxID=1048 RepID=UPI001A9CC192